VLLLMTQRMKAAVKKHNNSNYRKLNYLTLGFTYLIARVFNLYKFLAYDQPQFAPSLQDLQKLCRLLDQKDVIGFPQMSPAELNDIVALKAKLATVDNITVKYGAKIDWENIDLSPLVNLQSLSLYGSKDVCERTQRLPMGLASLQKLEELIILNFPLRSLPQEIGSLKGLKTLDLGFNLFKTIPDEIFELKEIERLNFRNCSEGMNIDEQTIAKFEQLTHLKELDLGYCNLPEDQKIKIAEKLGGLKLRGIMPNFQKFESYA
jgi:hypothetical protein